MATTEVNKLGIETPHNDSTFGQGPGDRISQQLGGGTGADFAGQSMTGFDPMPAAMGAINWNQVQSDLTQFKNELLGGGYNDFKPGMANVQSGTDQNQINQAYQHSQGGLQSQRNLLAGLQAQNGIGNQSNFLAQQQQLANQLQMQANGQGPNPAQNMLNQATQNNVNQQAALMAGQRGSSANAGMIARQAGMQGSNIQQQAAGQAATMGAQQQLGAQQMLGQQQQAMQGVAGQQVSNMTGMNTGYNQLAQNQQQMLLNANAQANNANVAMQSNANTVGGNVSMANQQNNKGILGGVMGGIGAIFGSMAHGGMVPNGYAQGGQVPSYGNGPQSQLGQMLAQGAAESSRLANNQAQDAQATSNVPKEQSSGGSMLMPFKGKSQSSSGSSAMSGISSMFASKGEMVPGKASVRGDNRANDTVPTMLSPGEVVIPRSVMQSKNAPDAAAKFVAALLAKKGKSA